LQTSRIETIDRQGKKELWILRGENDRPAASELSKSAFDEYTIRRTEHSAYRVSVPFFDLLM